MKRLRITYLFIIPCIIAIGLLVRIKQDWFTDSVNLYLGDALYAAMFLYVYSFLMPYRPDVLRAGYALATCYCIEFLQLYTAPWIMQLRATLPGKLLLGQGFLWSDILAYTIGVTVAFTANRIWLDSKKSVADSRLK